MTRGPDGAPRAAARTFAGKAQPAASGAAAASAGGGRAAMAGGPAASGAPGRALTRDMVLPLDRLMDPSHADASAVARLRQLACGRMGLSPGELAAAAARAAVLSALRGVAFHRRSAAGLAAAQATGAAAGAEELG
jgi:hypothetical protein